MTTAEGLLCKILLEMDYAEFHHWTELRIQEGSDEPRALCLDGTVILTEDEVALVEGILSNSV